MSSNVLTQENVVNKIQKIYFEQIESYLEEVLPDLVKQEAELFIDNGDHDDYFHEYAHDVLSRNFLDRILNRKFDSQEYAEKILNIKANSIYKLDERLEKEIESLAQEVVDHIKDYYNLECGPR